MTAFKTYKKTATVQAKLFEEGDEDGFITRYYNDEDVDEDGCIHTSGLIGSNEIKVPYVYTLENQKHLSHGFGREYLCVGVKGERWLVDKDIFESTYEQVSEMSDEVIKQKLEAELGPVIDKMAKDILNGKNK